MENRIAARAVLIFFAALILSGIPGLLGAVLSAIFVHFTETTEAAGIITAVVILTALLLRLAVLIAGARVAMRPGEGEPRRPSLWLVIGAGVFGLVQFPMESGIHMLSTFDLSRRLRVENYAEHLMQTTYLALGSGVLSQASLVGVLIWLWVRWSRASGDRPPAQF